MLHSDLHFVPKSSPPKPKVQKNENRIAFQLWVWNDTIHQYRLDRIFLGRTAAVAARKAAGKGYTHFALVHEHTPESDSTHQDKAGFATVSFYVGATLYEKRKVQIGDKQIIADAFPVARRWHHVKVPVGEIESTLQRFPAVKEDNSTVPNGVTGARVRTVSTAPTVPTAFTTSAAKRSERTEANKSVSNAKRVTPRSTVAPIKAVATASGAPIKAAKKKADRSTTSPLKTRKLPKTTAPKSTGRAKVATQNPAPRSKVAKNPAPRSKVAKNSAPATKKDGSRIGSKSKLSPAPAVPTKVTGAAKKPGNSCKPAKK